MAKIWNNIEITWEGESYTIRPTVEFVQFIEDEKGMSTGSLLLRAINHDLPLGRSCQLIAKTLNYKGVKINAQDVYEKFNGLNADLVTMATNILSACGHPIGGDDVEDPQTKKKSTAKKRN